MIKSPFSNSSSLDGAVFKKSISVIYQIINKNYMVISLYAEKIFDKI